MSDFHAIGGVSASLKALLRDRMEMPAAIPSGDFMITVSPADVQRPATVDVECDFSRRGVGKADFYEPVAGPHVRVPGTGVARAVIEEVEFGIDQADRNR